jgi:hypothetical protein
MTHSAAIIKSELRESRFFAIETFAMPHARRTRMPEPITVMVDLQSQVTMYECNSRKRMRSAKFADGE